MKRGSDGVVELPPSMNGNGHVALRSMFGTEIRVRRESLAYLVERLSADFHRPVIDKTALTGIYDYAVAYLPEGMHPPAAPPVAAESNPGAGPPVASLEERPDAFTALQTRLGLKLEPKKAPGEVLVIDRVEKTPTEN